MGKVIKYLSPVMIALTLVMVFWAIFTTPEAPTIENATAVGANLYWGYLLIAVAIIVAVGSACWDMVQKPEGIKGGLFAVVAMVVLVLVAYVIASGHSYQIVDLNTQGYFERGATVITDASIIVTYVVFALAILAAIYSAVTDSLK